MTAAIAISVPLTGIGVCLGAGLFVQWHAAWRERRRHLLARATLRSSIIDWGRR